MSIALDGLKEDGYRLENLQALKYDRANPLFHDDYLAKIYNLCRGSARRSGDGILSSVFGGNPESTFNAVVSFLAARPLIIMGEWQEDDTFKEMGFAFPVVMCGKQAPEMACFAGYGFFRSAWGTPELPVVAMLGLAYLFNEFQIKAIHGTRFEENTLTAKFVEQFGFKQVGRIPDYQIGKDGKLVPAIISTLLREDFEAYVEQFLVDYYRGNNPVQMIGTAEHPAIEESRETIDAQVQQLAAGLIPVVFFPRESSYVPGIPPGMQLRVVSQGPGAGIYFYNPVQMSAEIIDQAAAEGTHGKLLGHVQNKTDLLPNASVCTLQAIGSNGVILQDSVVERTKEAIAAQVEAFEARFPGCEVKMVDPADVVNARSAAKREEPVQQSLSWL